MTNIQRLDRTTAATLEAVAVTALALVILLGWGPAASAQQTETPAAKACCQEESAPEVEPVADAESGGCCGGGAGHAMKGHAEKGAGHAMKNADAENGCCGGGKGHGEAMEAGGTGCGMHSGEGGCPMHNAMSLVHQRSGIERQVENIANGIRSVTTAEDPALADLIEKHVRQVAGLIENGGRMRGWDPLFAAIFDNYEKIDMKIERIDNGVIVEETSADPYVAKLIQAHAAKVDEFLARGPAAVQEETPLPQR